MRLPWPNALLRWTTNGMETLATGNLSFARGYGVVASDGRLVAGIRNSDGRRAWVWSEDDGLLDLPLAPGMNENDYSLNGLSLLPSGSGLTFTATGASGSDTVVKWLEWTPASGSRVIKQWTMATSTAASYDYQPYVAILASDEGSTLLLDDYDADAYSHELGYSYALQRTTNSIEQLIFPPAVTPYGDDFIPGLYHHLSRDGSVIAGNGTIVDFCSPDCTGTTPLYRRAYRWVSTSGFVVRDVSRTGNPISALPGVTVRMTLGNQVFATNITDAAGRVQFSAQQIDPDEIYDVELEFNGLRRTYAAIRPSDVASGQVKLTLPVTLRRLLDAELTKLETTGALVLPYDTDAARDLTEQWNTDARLNHALHAARDQALGRLLTASESLATLYGSAEKLSMDSGKMMASTIVAIMSYQKALADLQKHLDKVAANQGNLAEYVERSLNFVIGSTLLSMEFAADQARVAFVDAAKKDLPPWAALLVDQSVAAIYKGVLGGLSGGLWDASGGSKSARGSLLEGLILTLGEQVGGRVLASAFVEITEPGLDTSIQRAQTQEGTGTVSAGYVASQERVILATERNDLALTASLLIGDTTKKAGYLADASILVGRLPAMEAVGLLGRVIKLLNIFATAGAAANDLDSLYQTTFNDAPAAGNLAFFPPAPSSSGEPLPRAAKTARRSLDAPPVVAAVVPASYTNTLALLAAAVDANDATNTLNYGETLFGEEPTLQAALDAASLRVKALVDTADPTRPALNAAYEDLKRAILDIQTDRIDLYQHVADYLLPDFTGSDEDPSVVRARILATVQSYQQAIENVESAIALAETEAAGLVLPPTLMVADHGLHPDTIDDNTPPGPVAVIAQVVNMGDSDAEGVTVTLTPGTNDGPVAIFRLTNDSVRVVGALASGASTTLVWNGIATDTSSSGSGSAALYDIAVTASSGSVESVSGGFTVAVEPATFAGRMAELGGAGALTNFTDDADGDGLDNGMELFLGTDLLVADAINLELERAHPLALRHPRTAHLASDLAARYQWSADLAAWFDDGASGGGVSVILPITVAGGEGTNRQDIVVTPQVIGGVATSLFVRLAVVHIPEAPPELAQPPVIITQPSDQYPGEGDTITLTVEATGTEPLIYQWYKNGALLDDAIEPDLTFTNASYDQEGTYRVRITNPGGSVTSSNASVTVSGGGFF